MVSGGCVPIYGRDAYVNGSLYSAQQEHTRHRDVPELCRYGYVELINTITLCTAILADLSVVLSFAFQLCSLSKRLMTSHSQWGN